ncbi:unnamed protein product, partial [Phaeothamnion confervicola]
LDEAVALAQLVPECFYEVIARVARKMEPEHYPLLFPFPLRLAAAGGGLIAAATVPSAVGTAPAAGGLAAAAVASAAAGESVGNETRSGGDSGRSSNSSGVRENFSGGVDGGVCGGKGGGGDSGGGDSCGDAGDGGRAAGMVARPPVTVAVTVMAQPTHLFHECLKEGRLATAAWYLPLIQDHLVERALSRVPAVAVRRGGTSAGGGGGGGSGHDGGD